MISHFAGRLWRSLPFVHSDPIYTSLHDGALTAPAWFFISPVQLWIGSLISKVNKAGTLEEDWLPHFSQSTTDLRSVLAPLQKQNGGIASFLRQFETGGMLLLGAILELASAASALGAPLILHNFLQTPDSKPLAWALVIATLLATICGRAKDEVCRVHSAWMECMLRSAIFNKSFHLSPDARLAHPAAKIININAVDVGFLTNYVLKIHDIWSAPLQIIGIGLLTFNLMGWTSCVGFALVALIFATQTQLGKRIGKSVGGYITHNDSRLGAFRDLLNNVKGVKAGAVEDVFHRKITSARVDQLKVLRSWLTTSFAMFTAVNQITPYLAACAAFLAYVISGATLTADVVFPCLAYFHLLYQPVTQASLALSRQFSVRPSLGRVYGLMTARETYMTPPGTDLGDNADAISFQAAAFEWPAEDPNETVPLIVGDLTIPRGRMTAVIGPNGAGKSSLLQAILGEMNLTGGTWQVHGSTAYCSQDPWVVSGTLRENIVFNSSRGFEKQRYDDVVAACALDADFARIPGGPTDALVGEAGSNLSGGQRARVSLARAMYSDAEVILLDDPLSAVDAHVRRRLFESIRQLEKTVVLVTLHTSYVSKADHVVVVDNGHIRWNSSSSAFSRQIWISEYIQRTNDSDEAASEADQVKDSPAPMSSDIPALDTGDAIDSLCEDEERANGAVDWSVAKFYFHISGGTGYALVVFAMTCLLIAAKVISQYWFVWWIAGSFGLNQEQYMGGFLGLTLFQALVTAGVGLTLVGSNLTAAKRVHEAILRNLIHAPLWFFQQNPTGRILNRLSKDIESVDSEIMNAVDGLLAASTTMIASVAIVALSGIYLLAAVLPFVCIVGWCLQRFRVTAREIQRLDSVLQSPALSIVSESLRATSSAKAYRAVPFLVNRHGHALDRLVAAKVCRKSLDTWITFRAELAAAVVLLVLTMLTLNGIIPRVSASLALATATTLARNVYLLAWAATELEIQLNSVERLQTYHDHIPSEDNTTELEKYENSHAPEWPRAGAIDISKAYLKYRIRTTPALDGISLVIQKGQKVGLIGRTGSGKSTLIAAIARLVDIQNGTITIGGVNTADIAPRKLRETVITLPQESLIFKGTLRENVDPHGRHQDHEIWAALESCQMKQVLEHKYGQDTALEHELSSDGTDLSAGQRQLVCAARVLLERPSILLVDEAAANVDFASDESLQRAWQDLPRDTTMITVAHRASSLAWMDRILVMDNGKVVEDGSPQELLQPSQIGSAPSYYLAAIQQDGREAVERALQTAKNSK